MPRVPLIHCPIGRGGGRRGAAAACRVPVKGGPRTYRSSIVSRASAPAAAADPFTPARCFSAQKTVLR